ncbi:MAG: hypothetical protein AAF500_11500 [Myxococcota bacterium]
MPVADASPKPARWTVREVVPLFVAAGVGLVVADGGFVFDDRHALHENPIVNGEAPVWEAFVRDFWGRPASIGFTTWRPLMPLAWRGLWALSPDTPLSFHLLSALLHVLAVGAAMHLLRRLRASADAAFIVGLLFAAHPLNTEAVSAVVAQADLTAFTLTVTACAISLRTPAAKTGWAAAAVLLVASLFKESALVFAPLVALLGALQATTTRERWRTTLPVLLVLACGVAFQLSLPRAPGIQMFTGNLAHQADGWLRFLLGLHNVGQSLAMTVWPFPIAPNHGYAAVELVAARLVPYAVVGAVLLAIGILGGIAAIVHRRLDWITALCFLYAPALLQSHWFARLITDLAERLLYPSVLGISMMVAFGLLRLVESRPWRTAWAAGFAMAFFAASFAPRRAWTDTDALWTYAVHVEPRAALHHHNVSNTYFRANDVARGAYHRLRYTHFVRQFPEPVDWTSIEENLALPPDQRFAALPEDVRPDDPCPLVRAFVKDARRHPPLYDYTVAEWSTRYHQCLTWPEDR